jgi:hypothetical protein
MQAATIQDSERTINRFVTLRIKIDTRINLHMSGPLPLGAFIIRDILPKTWLLYGFA